MVNAIGPNPENPNFSPVFLIYFFFSFFFLSHERKKVYPKLLLQQKKKMTFELPSRKELLCNVWISSRDRGISLIVKLMIIITVT